jgi:hypothetical protein
MKTSELIEMLAQGVGPVAPHAARRRLLQAGLAGLGVAVLLALLLKGPVPAALFATPAPWMKLAYATALVGATAGWLWRLARPGADRGGVPQGLQAVLALVALAGAVVVALAAPGGRAAAVLGSTWDVCPRNVALLSLPALAALLWALRGLAPTRPAVAGLVAGLLAGAVGAAAYGLTCPEPSVAFVAVWYSAGVALAGALGALLGARLLRW